MKNTHDGIEPYDSLPAPALFGSRQGIYLCHTGHMNTNEAATIRPGTEVTLTQRGMTMRGVVTSRNAKTGTVEVMWIGSPYPVRENPSELTTLEA